MKTGRLLREETVLLDSVQLTENGLERARGLLFRDEEIAQRGLIIASCSSVHSCFMSYSIDVVYLNKKYEIIKICNRMKPWRFSFAKGAATVLELSAGMVEKLNLKIGDVLIWQED